VLRLDPDIWPQTIQQFQRCGRGERECVTYWVGPLDDSERVDLAVHPIHTARAGHYQVNDAWLTTFWFRLANERRSVRAQVHTHGGTAWHSKTDDDWPLIQTAGFLSLVVPDFAMTPFDQRLVHVARLERGGQFARVALDDVVREG
jgi:hypothetical protein